MIIEINDTKTIEDITKEFSGCWPYLKIEFFEEPHHWQQPSAFSKILPHDKTIGDLRTRQDAAAMEIHAWRKTGAVEQEFKNIFGLNVQVFRRQADTWIETADSDELTLEEQNIISSNAMQELLDDKEEIKEKNHTDE